ncbi:SbcC/MukB-like Walker B domain-containing protein [Nocardia sp. NPDC006630]|uniref:ATP-binding protein n=1 Tax=Nocardia sp. NPDC006630 TaxID=3157181 RepID=UPI0033A7138A
MTMIDTLFGLIPQASRGEQWVARDLQLINWGGYDGHHRVRLSPGATLLCGESGSGKSTLMDSYIALIMPHTMPFNGASNGGIVGRPRGKDQRNIVSYARGKIDESRTAGETKARVLRGDGRDTWSAIAMTWVDQTGKTFTAVRAWYVPSAARSVDDLVQLRATCDDTFDLRMLEQASKNRLADQAVKALGLRPHNTDKDYVARLHTALGIGAAGDGNKAVALLGRIQAGQQITTVDALYKTMVLEEPSTLATADEVVKQFDELSNTRIQMQTAQQQVNALSPIRGHRRAICDANEQIQMIDDIGSFTAPSAPAGLWCLGKRVELLESVRADLETRRNSAKSEFESASVVAEAAAAERDAVKETLRMSGGDRLANALREQEAAERRLGPIRQARSRLDNHLEVLGRTAADKDEFADLVEQARSILADEKARESARDKFADARSHVKDLEKRLAVLGAERKTALAHRNNIPNDLQQARAELAEAAGLTLEQMPFVAELIEVRTEFEPWREAFNLALGGFATRILIDTAHLDNFRAKINSVRTARRIQFEGVPTGLRDAISLNDRELPGRLEYRNSPFTAWLKNELAQRFRYVCVESPRTLGHHSKALTISGQISDGRRGAHGGQGRRNVLGFTNNRLLELLDEQINALDEETSGAARRLEHADAALKSFENHRLAYSAVAELAWEQVDVDSIIAERDRWAGIIDDVQSGNPEISRLQDLAKKIDAKVKDLDGARARAEVKAQDTQKAFSLRDTETEDTLQALDDAVESGQDVSEQHRDYLTELFSTNDGGDAPPEKALDWFDMTISQVAKLVTAQRQTAEAAISSARRSLAIAFASFVERWPNPNLGTDPDASYGDFERVLDELEASQLHELQEQWRDSLLKLSGNDLTSLDSELNAAIREIKDRIEPINQILAGLAFSDEDHRLRIDVRDSHTAVRAGFRNELRAVRQTIDQAAGDSEREQAYLRMSKVINRIRRNAPDFGDLVDVRNHIRISAEKLNAADEHVALYDHIGEKSGGESQELVAFIVGSALRYQLGDGNAERPRYAPVFLDEALIKADARYTGRAIQAWRGLGFQLIVGAPNDKNSAIEPHVDAQYLILKTAQSRSWAKPIVGVSEGEGQ